MAEAWETDDCIALIGYRATGKTTVAEKLSQRIGWPWVDSDIAVEIESGKSIDRLFTECGESGFRDIESLVVTELCRRTRTIVAMGGGVVVRERNRRALRGCQAVVWLKASVDEIHRRMSSDPWSPTRRPNLTKQGGRTEIASVLAEREPFYRACATLEVDTQQKTPDEIADEIIAALSPSG